MRSNVVGAWLVAYNPNASIVEEAKRIRDKWEALTYKQDWIVIDAAGIGAGVVDLLRDWGLPVIAGYRR